LLDYVVVDKIKDAEMCVEFLKKNNIGRATFISLEKMGVHE
jgi:chromosome segregation ATPase